MSISFVNISHEKLTKLVRLNEKPALDAPWSVQKERNISRVMSWYAIKSTILIQQNRERYLSGSFAIVLCVSIRSKNMCAFSHCVLSVGVTKVNLANRPNRLMLQDEMDIILCEINLRLGI